MRIDRRWVVLALAVLVLLTALVPAFYIAHEADHDCAGEGCGVCVSIRHCTALLNSVSTALLVFCALLLAVLSMLLASGAVCAVLRQSTPVSRKVRLNN